MDFSIAMLNNQMVSTWSFFGKPNLYGPWNQSSFVAVYGDAVYQYKQAVVIH